MKCNKCGAEVPDDAKFCIECGNNLEEQRAEAVKEAPGDPAVEETAEAPEVETTEAEVPEAATPEKEAPEEEVPEAKAPEAAPKATGQDEDLEEKTEEVSESEKETATEQNAAEPADEETAPESGSEKAPAFTCPHCGAEIHPGDKFCTKCGATLVAPEPPMGQPAQPVTQQPVQPPVQQPPMQQPQQVPYQQPVQHPYYGQPQYQQPGQYPPQYAQPQQPQYAPQYAQPQQPAPEKPKRGKTPFWVWIIVGVLAAALIFCIVWFFVVPNVGNSGNSGAAQSGQAADSDAPARVDVNDDSEYARQAEKELGESAESTIRDTTNSWRNKRLLSNVVADDYFWDGNSLVVIVDVSINYEASYFNAVGTYYKWYYTYVRYNNVYYEDGSIHYEDSSRPHGKLLNLYTDTSGDHHYVSGYSSEEAARSAAGV